MTIDKDMDLRGSDIEVRIVCSGRGKERHKDYMHVHTIRTDNPMVDGRARMAEWTASVSRPGATETERECLPLCMDIREVSRWVRVGVPHDPRYAVEIPTTGKGSE